MSQSIVRESVFLLHSILLGIAGAFLYDIFRVLRRVIRHGNLLIAVEDMVFWIVASFAMFYVLFQENNGTIRWFFIAGACLGVILYVNTFGRIFTKVCAAVINKIKDLLFRLLRILLKPVRFILKKTRKLGGKVKNKNKRILRFLKMRLTAKAKEVKIFYVNKKKKGSK